MFSSTCITNSISRETYSDLPNGFCINQVTDKSLLIEGSMSPRDGRIRDDHYIFMVLEFGEIDLAHMVAQKWKERNNSNMKIDENWLRFYWQVASFCPN